MTDRFQSLIEKVDAADKAELTVAYNARISALKAFQERPGRATRDDKDACDSNYTDTLDRLWAKYHPDQAAKDEGALWFRTKKDAFAWYADQGGQRQKSSFYDTVPAEGKRVTRYSVSEMLRKEKATSPAAIDMSGQREDAETRKAVADADKSQMQAEEMRRALDAKWMLRERADEEICVWVSRLRDATAYHLGRALLGLIHACGGQPARLAEVQALIDDALATACNEIANSDEITVDIEDFEEVDG